MTASVQPDPSHYFDNPRGRTVLDWMHELGMDVQIEPRVAADVAVDREDRTVFLPLGHPWDHAHRLICRGALFIAGGAEWAPEFLEHATPCLARSNVTTLPLLRRPW